MKFLLACLFLLQTPLALAKLSHESEISSVVTGGNSDVETYLFKTTNQYQRNLFTYRLSGHYTYGEAAGTVSARDWDLSMMLERMITRRFALFVGEVTEGLPFSGIKARYNLDAGIKYYYIKKDDFQFFSELGYRYTVEDRVEPEDNRFENKGRLFTEIHDRPSENFSYKFWVEYIPNFTDREDYILIHEASITSILTSVFSLKLAYRGTYDDKPATPGNKNYDYTYTTSLVARF